MTGTVPIRRGGRGSAAVECAGAGPAGRRAIGLTYTTAAAQHPDVLTNGAETQGS
ncbi:hypothetical protein J2Z21_003730 [Streptomyces griseochromogenes]|uniref:Uncharacterized protein n=1 Tax=Streptomyces griseochromogenes TaxID=68214 RepID=A0ABS4LTQ9_9ACTN|nr:hypothetical protein [Streptomyces griseochromogenes]MBP2050780.1 hypothetical protein [Streptomyces griseochromogenes]